MQNYNCSRLLPIINSTPSEAAASCTQYIFNLYGLANIENVLDDIVFE